MAFIKGVGVEGLQCLPHDCAGDQFRVKVGVMHEYIYRNISEVLDRIQLKID